MPGLVDALHDLLEWERSCCSSTVMSWTFCGYRMRDEMVQVVALMSVKGGTKCCVFSPSIDPWDSETVFAMFLLGNRHSVTSAKKEIGDDGYDDFGVKKKNGKATKAEREAAALARLQQSYRFVKTKRKPGFH